MLSRLEGWNSCTYQPGAGVSMAHLAEWEILILNFQLWQLIALQPFVLQGPAVPLWKKFKSGSCTKHIFLSGSSIFFKLEIYLLSKCSSFNSTYFERVLFSSRIAGFVLLIFSFFNFAFTSLIFRFFRTYFTCFVFKIAQDWKS